MGGRARHHFQNKRLFTSNAVHFEHFGKIRKRFDEQIVRTIRRGVATDERNELKTQEAVVELRSIAAHVSAAFQPLHAIVHGWRLQSDDLPEFGKGGARIALQCLKQSEVEVVEFTSF